MNRLFPIIMLFLSLFLYGFAGTSPAWKRVSPAIPEPSVNAVLVHPRNNSIVFIATLKAVYRSVDAGETFTQVLRPSGNLAATHTLFVDPQDPRKIYAAGDSGLYASGDGGEHWKQVFQSRSAEESKCFSIAVIGENIFLGTGKGLFLKKGSSVTWQKISAIGEEPVAFLVHDDDYLYIATSHQLLRLDYEGNEILQVFSLPQKEGEFEETAEVFSDEDVIPKISQIKAVCLLPGDPSVLYLSANKKILESFDDGQSWRDFPSTGLPVDDLTDLAVTQDNDLWAGTAKGVYRYVNGRWIPIYQGMETNLINKLASDDQGDIYAATDSGIFVMALGKVLSPGQARSDLALSVAARNFDEYSEIEERFSHEPSITAVQKDAIDYAEVHPDKIKQWRSAARRKALLPKLSAGMDKDNGELFHWDTGPNPDVLLKGRHHFDWDMSVSWDFGELIWNPDQTSIDSRSKLMVELREDILDQVTRLYFERRRLQMELLSPASDPAVKLEKQMRVAELTAMLDAFTGGGFSRKISENHSVSN